MRLDIVDCRNGCHTLSIPFLARLQTGAGPVLFLLGGFACGWPKVFLSHHDTLAIRTHRQNIRCLLSALSLLACVKRLKILCYGNRHILRLTLGHLAAGGLHDICYYFTKRMETHFFSHPSSQHMGVFVFGKVKLPIQWELALNTRDAVTFAAYRHIPEDRSKPSFTIFSTMSQNVAIGSSQIIPAWLPESTQIQM
jgi:hypothetical protein